MRFIKKSIITLTIQVVLFLVVSPNVVAGQFEDAKTAESRQDYAIAFNIYRQLAEQGHAQSTFKVGVYYACGYSVPKDEIEAVRWYYKSAELGCAEGQFQVGLTYCNPYKAQKANITEAPEEAIRWIRKAAEQGYPNAQTYLGSLYGVGYGGLKDQAEGDKWTLRAANQGFGIAQFHMGRIYESGESSFPKDNVKAYMWYSLAVATGAQRAPEFLEKIAQKMTTEQIDEAKRLANEWKPQKEQ